MNQETLRNYSLNRFATSSMLKSKTLALDPRNSSTVYAGAAGGGVQLSRNFLCFIASDQWGGVFVLHRISFAGVAIILFAVCLRVNKLRRAIQLSQASLRGLRITIRRRMKASGFLASFPTTGPLQPCENYEPLTTSEKFKIASQDAFDRGTVALAALFGGDGQLTNSNRSFGQGAAGFGQVFRRVIWRLADRRLHDRGSLPHSSPPGSALLSTQHWKRMVQARLRHGADLLDPSRFGRNAVQLFGSTRKLNRGSNFERLLRGQPNSFQRRVRASVCNSASTWLPIS